MGSSYVAKALHTPRFARTTRTKVPAMALDWRKKIAARTSSKVWGDFVRRGLPNPSCFRHGLFCSRRPPRAGFLGESAPQVWGAILVPLATPSVFRIGKDSMYQLHGTGRNKLANLRDPPLLGQNESSLWLRSSFLREDCESFNILLGVNQVRLGHVEREHAGIENREWRACLGESAPQSPNGFRNSQFAPHKKKKQPPFLFFFPSLPRRRGNTSSEPRKYGLSKVLSSLTVHFPDRGPQRKPR